MPLSKYFKGHGEEVMKKMRGKYGSKKGTNVFYATAKARGLEPSDKLKSKHGIN